MRTRNLVRLLAPLALLSTLNHQLSTSLAAPLGTAFTYQGRLTERGTPANGRYELAFRLYDAPSNGTLQGLPMGFAAWPVSNGLFTVPLDFGSNIFHGQALWLQVDVMTNGGVSWTELSPRQPLTAAPYALFTPAAGTAITAASATSATTIAANGVTTASLQAGAVTTDKIADGTITTTDIATIDGGKVVGGDLAAARLKVGTGHTLSGPWATIGGGTSNTASWAFATVSGGAQNSASDEGAVVAGGSLNIADQAYDTVSGGYANTASGGYATVSGGHWNSGSGFMAMVGGGDRNTAYGRESTIAGGFMNTASGQNSVIAGGYGNAAHGTNAVIGGGWGNLASAGDATVGGGHINNIQRNADFSTIGGGSDNTIQNNAPYTTISGGKSNTITETCYGTTIAGGEDNLIGVNSGWSVISGGQGNQMYYFTHGCVIGGGRFNYIDGDLDGATIVGGNYNSIAAHSSYSTILGGNSNSIGDASMHAVAAGQRAKANHTGTFVWADSTSADFASTAVNQFLIRASGGVGIGTTSPQQALHVIGDAIVRGTNFSASGHTARLILGDENHALRSVYGGGLRFGVWPYPDALVIQDTSGNVGIGNNNPTNRLMVINARCDGSSWINASDRNLKESFAPVDPQSVLKKVAALPVQTWNYKAQPGQKHLGPVAQDFRAAFGLGADNTSIATVDADGVALAAIQGLNQKVESGKLKAEGRMERLEAVLQEKDARITELEQRLVALERLLNVSGE